MVLAAVISGTIEKNNNLMNEPDKIELNHIAMSASEYDIDKVNLSTDVKNELLNSVNVYKVKTKRYGDNDIKRIIKKGLNSNIKSSDEYENIRCYELSNGGNVTYYKNSGTISYNASYTGNNKSSSELITNNILKEKAIKFIEMSDIFDMDQLEFYKANPSITVKTLTGEKIVEYEVIFTKIPPESIDGFDGTGPGIIIQLDCDGNVTGFVSIDKDVEVLKKEYPAKKIKQIESDIVNNNNVMIYSDEEIGKQVKLDKIECVLYSDSIQEEQDYMVPHYRLKNNNGADIVLPAIDNSYITIKNN